MYKKEIYLKNKATTAKIPKQMDIAAKVVSTLCLIYFSSRSSSGSACDNQPGTVNACMLKKVEIGSRIPISNGEKDFMNMC